MNTALGIIVLVVFSACFVGVVVGSFIDNTVMIFSFLGGLFLSIIIGILLVFVFAKIRAKKIDKYGKPSTGKLVGAILGSRKETNIGTRHDVTCYFYPIIETEDIFGNKTQFTGVKMIKDRDLQKLVYKKSVKFTYYKKYCNIDEDFSLLPDAGTIPYLGKNMVLDENDYWKPAKVKKKQSSEGQNKSGTGLWIYKLGLTVLSIIELAIIGGATFFFIYGINTNQFSLIIGAPVVAFFSVLFNVKIFKSFISVLLVTKKGRNDYAKEFTTDVVYYHSQDAGSTTNYVVNFSFIDDNGEIQTTQQYVMDEAYFIINHLDKLPIKVYKKYASIDLDKVL